MKQRANRLFAWAAIGACVAGAAYVVSWHGFTLPVWIAEIRSGEVLTHASSESRVVALTFDDGPDPTFTPQVLKILKRYGAKATFFEEGRMVRRYPEITRQVASAGHTIGNHTETHPFIDRITEAQIDSEITACDEALAAATGIRPHLFRPPRGDWTPAVYAAAVKHNELIILWSVALEHNDAPLPADMAVRVLRLVRPGGVILMHDGGSRERTVQALPLLLDGLKARGYKFVTVPELFGVPGEFPIPTLANRVTHNTQATSLVKKVSPNVP